MKHAITKAEPRLLDISLPSAEMDAAGRINYFHALSKQAGEVSIRAALWAGLELYRMQLARQGSFEAWLEQNVDFGRATAYRYLALLKQSIGASADLTEVSEYGTERRRELIDRYSGEVESKNMTEMMVDYGIIKKSKSNMGGHREGAGRKRKQSAEELSKQAEAISNALTAEATRDCVAQLYCLGITQGGFGEMPDTDLKGAIDTLESALQKAKEIIKSRASNTRTSRA